MSKVLVSSCFQHFPPPPASGWVLSGDPRDAHRWLLGSGGERLRTTSARQPHWAGHTLPSVSCPHARTPLGSHGPATRGDICFLGHFLHRGDRPRGDRGWECAAPWLPGQRARSLGSWPGSRPPGSRTWLSSLKTGEGCNPRFSCQRPFQKGQADNKRAGSLCDAAPALFDKHHKHRMSGGPFSSFPWARPWAARLKAAGAPTPFQKPQDSFWETFA